MLKHNTQKAEAKMLSDEEIKDVVNIVNRSLKVMGNRDYPLSPNIYRSDNDAMLLLQRLLDNYSFLRDFYNEVGGHEGLQDSLLKAYDTGIVTAESTSNK